MLEDEMFIKMLPIFLYAPEDDAGGGGSGGDDGGKKFAGKYNSAEDLENGYKNLESNQGKLAAELADARAKFQEITAKNQRGAEEAAVLGDLKEAQAALDKFSAETDWDNLRGKAQADATRERIRLEDKVEQAKEGHAKIKSKSSEESIRKLILSDISQSDAGEATKLMKTHKLEASEVREFANENDCQTYVEAVYRILLSKQAVELSRLQKLEKEMAKKGIHDDPKKDDPPRNAQPGRGLSREDQVKLVGSLPTLKSFEAAIAAREKH